MVEQIVTDSGAQTAAQIEALRSTRQRSAGDRRNRATREPTSPLAKGDESTHSNRPCRAFMMFASLSPDADGHPPTGSGRGRATAVEDARECAIARSRSRRSQDRIRVLEQIVTDRGAETAAQIEALRERDQIPSGGQG